MLYIFTHELIHMVRFARYEAYYYMHPQKRPAEETRVHRKAREILRALAFWPGMPETLSYFDKTYEGGGRDAHL